MLTFYTFEVLNKKRMKKIILAICFVTMGSSIALAQLTPPGSKKKISVKTQTSPGLESYPTRPQPAQPTNAAYSLSSVKVSVQTGNDNKESLSNVSVELAVRNSNYSLFAQNNLTNELKSNSITVIGLEKSTSYISEYNINPLPGKYSTTTSGSQAIMLSDIEAYGLSLRIIYKPNFFADAWKIETVSATLEFRDVNGNLHPTSGQKTITFSNTATFLDNFDKRILICTADKYFSPLTSFVTKDFSLRW